MSYAYMLENGLSKLHSVLSPRRLDIVADVYGASMTREEFAAECDINVLMERYNKANVWPLPPRDQEPVYYDFVGMPDLQDAIRQMDEADEAFMRLPASVRKEFDNDPVRFVEFASSEDNLERLREWGLAKPVEPTPPPMRVQVVPDGGAPPVAPASAAAKD